MKKRFEDGPSAREAKGFGRSAQRRTHSAFHQPAKLGPLEIDLHLHELPPLHREATAHEKLLHQLDHARRAIAEARRRGDRRIVLIHGNGSGRLRHELEQMLRKDAGLRYFDASYQLFGQGRFGGGNFAPVKIDYLCRRVQPALSP